MADGRTPTLIISGTAGSVVFEEITSAYPFPAQVVEREMEIRHTRRSSTGPRKTVAIVQDYNGSEDSLEFSATVDLTAHDTLRSLATSNPPEVSVTYRDQNFEAVFWYLSPAPDELGDYDPDFYGPIEFVVTIRLRRTDL